ncbi:GNAT family N-acetyltransferase [Rhizobium sp. Root1220]|uniref:GNAT family N-acetyltransferase n=1 Tax=Rhizobium sp. Root1220 TaxID=1736432 RepID=UPI0006FC8608|nr:GNAT family N-acetyltransferase [Rhizobium sp. Root1220]KQV64446.1 acetyltransferase [Rhizobium sp. Root1220]
MELRTDPYPPNSELNALWQAAWDETGERDFMPVLSRSLTHVGAYDGERLTGFVNVAWDGGMHAFVLDTCVHPEFRRRGIATALVGAAKNLASARGAKWLHVDFETRLTEFYRGCGFVPTSAGIMRLA